MIKVNNDIILLVELASPEMFSTSSHGWKKKYLNETKLINDFDKTMNGRGNCYTLAILMPCLL